MSRREEENHRELTTRLARLEFLLSEVYCNLTGKAVPDDEREPLKPCRWCGRERTEEDRRDDGLRLCKDHRACDARRTEAKTMDSAYRYPPEVSADEDPYDFTPRRKE